MRDIELLVYGEVFIAQMSPDGMGVWNIYIHHNQVSDDYVGSVILREGQVVDNILAEGSIIDDDVWQDVVEQFQTKVLEAANEEYTELDQREDIPEITPPLPEYTEVHGLQAESVESALNSTDFVLATCMDDPTVLLARILHNQRTILAYIAKDYE